MNFDLRTSEIIRQKVRRNFMISCINLFNWSYTVIMFVQLDHVRYSILPKSL